MRSIADDWEVNREAQGFRGLVFPLAASLESGSPAQWNMPVNGQLMILALCSLSTFLIKNFVPKWISPSQVSKSPTVNYHTGGQVLSYLFPERLGWGESVTQTSPTQPTHLHSFPAPTAQESLSTSGWREEIGFLTLQG